MLLLRHGRIIMTTRVDGFTQSARKAWRTSAAGGGGTPCSVHLARTTVGTLEWTKGSSTLDEETEKDGGADHTSAGCAFFMATCVTATNNCSLCGESGGDSHHPRSLPTSNVFRFLALSVQSTVAGRPPLSVQTGPNEQGTGQPEEPNESSKGVCVYVFADILVHSLCACHGCCYHRYSHCVNPMIRVSGPTRLAERYGSSMGFEDCARRFM